MRIREVKDEIFESFLEKIFIVDEEMFLGLYADVF